MENEITKVSLPQSLSFLARCFGGNVDRSLLSRWARSNQRRERANAVSG